MPRYYFDIDDGETASEDDEGLELSGLAEARYRAISVLPNIAQEVLPDGDEREFSVIVRDSKGAALFRAALSFRGEWLIARPPFLRPDRPAKN